MTQENSQLPQQEQWSTTSYHGSVLDQAPLTPTVQDGEHVDLATVLGANGEPIRTIVNGTKTVEGETFSDLTPLNTDEIDGNRNILVRSADIEAIRKQNRARREKELARNVVAATIVRPIPRQSVGSMDNLGNSDLYNARPRPVTVQQVPPQPKRR